MSPSDHQTMNKETPLLAIAEKMEDTDKSCWHWVFKLTDRECGTLNISMAPRRSKAMMSSTTQLPDFKPH